MSTASETDRQTPGDAHHAALLHRLAARYIWWQKPDEAILDPRRVIAQVMNIGDFDDARAMANTLGEDALKAVLSDAAAGWFNGKSWSYWHYRLGLTPSDEEPPPMPERF
jgi:hypothetical protein